MRLRVGRLWKQIRRKLGRWSKQAKGVTRSMTSSCRTPKVTDGFSDLVVNGVANLPPTKARSAETLAARQLARSGTADDLTIRAMAACRAEKEGKLHIESDAGEDEMDEEWMLEMLQASEQPKQQVRWRDGTLQRYGSAVDMRQLLAGDSNEGVTAKQRTGTVVPLGTLNGTPSQRNTPTRQYQGPRASHSQQKFEAGDRGSVGGNGGNRLGYHRPCRSGSVPAAMDVMSIPLRPPPGRRRPTAPK